MKYYIIFLTLFITIACSKHPLGKDYIYTAKDDKLSSQEKIDLLWTFNTVENDALLAVISSLYAKNNNLIEAKASILQAIKIKPTNASYYLKLANYNLLLNNHFFAYNEVRIAKELGANNHNLELLLANLAIKTADTVRGKEFVTKYYQKNKELLDAKLLMAKMYLLEKNYYSASKLAKQILVKDSTNFKGLHILYKISKILNNTNLAIIYGNKLINQNPTNAQIYLELGSLYSKKNQTTLAANYYAKSYKYRNSISSLCLAIDSYSKLNLIDSVLFITDSIFSRKNYNNKCILLARARAFNKRYKYNEAYLLYAKLVKMDSTDSLFSTERAIVRRKIAYLQHRKQKNN